MHIIEDIKFQILHCRYSALIIRSKDENKILKNCSLLGQSNLVIMCTENCNHHFSHRTIVLELWVVFRKRLNG